eukprot:COSAG05_NODE_43_length_25931_cov_49.314636_27_plen_129_part_00
MQASATRSRCFQYPASGIQVFTVPHFRDPGGFPPPPSGILVLAAAFSGIPVLVCDASGSRWSGRPTFGIQVGLRPLFRHPGGFSPPPSGIQVISRPALRDPEGHGCGRQGCKKLVVASHHMGKIYPTN